MLVLLCSGIQKGLSAPAWPLFDSKNSEHVIPLCKAWHWLLHLTSLCLAGPQASLDLALD